MHSMSAEESMCCTSLFRKDSLRNVDWTILRGVITRLMTSVTATGSICLIGITISIYDSYG